MSHKFTERIHTALIRARQRISDLSALPRRIFQTKEPIPPNHRRNFTHLYFDIAWFGVVAGSALAFTAVYATRLGATAFQLGLLNAGPAIVSMLATIPAGKLLERSKINKMLVQNALLMRLRFLLFALLPLLFIPATQIWAMIALVLLSAIPSAAVMVSFNALFSDSVPTKWRAYVSGIRNALYALCYTVTTLGCGMLLNKLPDPLGYQIVFAIAFVGGLMTTMHLHFVHPIKANKVKKKPRPKQKSPGLDWGILKGRYGRVILVLFLFRLTHYLVMPLTPLYTVDTIHLTDQELSLGLAIFHIAFFLGSTQLNRLSRRLKQQSIVAIGALLVAVNPLLLALTHNLGIYIIVSLVDGFAWSLASGSVGNYLLEHIPPDKRGDALSWYNLTFNAAILVGSMLGSTGAEILGLVPTLIVAGVLRLLAAFAIWRRG